MNRRRSPLARLLPLLACGYIRLVGWTTRTEQRIPDSVRACWTRGEPLIYVTWHRHQLFGTYYGGWARLRVLISSSRDGELIAAVATRLGFVPVRGSSSRGGAGALRALAQALEQGHSLLITPDGPRGPRGVVKPGVVALSRLTGARIAPVAVVPSRAVVLKSWDAFVVPLPLGRGCLVCGEPLDVRGDDDTTAAARVGAALDEVSVAAATRAGAKFDPRG